jgi:ATP-binding protein involved in chromosome partitioning
MLTEDAIRAALSTVKYPGFSRDIISFGLIKDIAIQENDVTIKLVLQTKDPAIAQEIYKNARAALETIEGIGNVDLDFNIENPPAQAAQGPAGLTAKLNGVKKIIAVGSGKGGVGKSTVASNLAIALSKLPGSPRVGLCDCDLYGPSIALMFGTDERPLATEDNEIIPIKAHGLQLMSMGFLLEDDSPVIVRGPLATRYIQQFLKQVLWEDLDYLVLDLPPGTGDIQLTIVQTAAIDGAVIVTTPQEVALIDARKATAMFAKVNVPVAGIVENMSYFLCPSDGIRYNIFGEGGGEKEAARLGVPLLAQIPIDIPTRQGGDSGKPIALTPPEESPISAAFHDLAAKVAAAVS